MSGILGEEPLGNRSINDADFMWRHIHGFHCSGDLRALLKREGGGIKDNAAESFGFKRRGLLGGRSEWRELCLMYVSAYLHIQHWSNVIKAPRLIKHWQMLKF